MVTSPAALLALVRRPTPGADVAGTEDRDAESVASSPSATNVWRWASAPPLDRERQGHRAVLPAPGLRDEPLRDALVDRIACRDGENDANAAAWAETATAPLAASGWSVRHAGHRIGGGLVVSGVLYRGASGVACEWGHMVAVPDGRRCACGNRAAGDVPAALRGPRRPRAGRGLAGRGAPAAGAVTATRPRSPHDVTIAPGRRPGRGRDIHRHGRWLAGIADLAAIIDPSVVVIGRRSRRPGVLLLAPAQEAFAANLTAAASGPPRRSGSPPSAPKPAYRRRRPRPPPVEDRLSARRRSSRSSTCPRGRRGAELHRLPVPSYVVRSMVSSGEPFRSRSTSPPAWSPRGRRSAGWRSAGARRCRGSVVESPRLQRSALSAVASSTAAIWPSPRRLAARVAQPPMFSTSCRPAGPAGRSTCPVAGTSSRVSSWVVGAWSERARSS